MPNTIQVKNLGLIDYEEALQTQLSTLEESVSSETDFLIICSHPPVVTLGRATQPSDLIGWQGQTVEVSRGGRATYHGPSQVVVYPILNLNKESRVHLPKRDLHVYLRLLETAVVETINSYGVNAEVKTTEVVDESGKKLSLTGVWVNDKKIASIGVAVKKWTTYHGVAINLFNDPEAFKGINPCGFSTDVMTDLEREIDSNISRVEFESRLANRLMSLFS